MRTEGQTVSIWAWIGKGTVYLIGALTIHMVSAIAEVTWPEAMSGVYETIAEWVPVAALGWFMFLRSRS